MPQPANFKNFTQGSVTVQQTALLCNVCGVKALLYIMPSGQVASCPNCNTCETANSTASLNAVIGNSTATVAAALAAPAQQAAVT